MPQASTVVQLVGMGDITQRLQNREQRVHVNLGPTCNNNCIFCMEEDREARQQVNSALTPARVAEILEANRGAAEVCFTSGEPTLVAQLPEYATLARELGYTRRSVMTNGRRLSYRSYTRGLVRAGINFFYVSIHGHTAKLHDALVRTYGAFEQTRTGVENVAELWRYGVTLHTSTVVTRRNLPHLAEIYAFLRQRGVHQVVFNVMQANGRAHTHFERIFPPYALIAAEMGRLLDESEEARPEAFLVDIPLCVTEGVVPDYSRGYVEHYVHYDIAHGELVSVARSELDDSERVKRPECARCRYDPVCAGVWRNYIARMGWAEFEPVPPPG